MSDSPFLRFIDLVTFDQKIQSIENDIVIVTTEIASLKKQEEDIAHDINEMHAVVNQLRKKVDEYELEMKTFDQKEKEKKQLLDRLSDYKEYQAIKAEVEAIQRVQVEHEQIILDAWGRLENAQALEKKKKSSYTETAKQFNEQLEQLTAKIKLLQEQHDNLLKEREKKEQLVPSEWLEKYIMMRARAVDPVVPIVHQSCGACSQMITNQDCVRARRGALVQCQKCYRLLYDPEIMEKRAV